jgi:hypothetical protein
LAYRRVVEPDFCSKLFSKAAAKATFGFVEPADIGPVGIFAHCLSHRVVDRTDGQRHWGYFGSVTQMPSHSLENIDTPLPGKVIEVAPGILWVLLALLLILDHVNVYLMADDDGWTIVDAGFYNAATRDAWEALLTGPLAGKPVRRLIITHHHPDHVGAAGWLLGRTGAQLVMTREEFLMSLYCLGSSFKCNFG